MSKKIVFAALAAGALLFGAAGQATAAGEVHARSWLQCQSYEWVGDGPMFQLPDANRDFDCWLARGSNNNGVYALQRALNKCYYKNLYQDGVYGPATERAVREVQAAEGAAVDGEYGNETRQKMLWPGYWGDGYMCEKLGW